ncbi:MAG: carboxypeptidase regulatory-like domain-containing protein [Pseudomonadota bacterium]
MKLNHCKFRTGWSFGLLLLLAACGGGGGGSDAGTGAPIATAPAPDSGTGPVSDPAPTTPLLSTLSGVAATGAAFAGAAVTVTDRTGATVCTTQTDAAGAYACLLPANSQAPLVIKAVRDEQIFYSITASSASGTANVTPLTTIIVSQLSPDGNPASLAGAIVTQPDIVTADTIKAQVAELVAALQPLLSALGQTIDPIAGVFIADGTGQDRVLDAISVSVRPDGSAANIEITVKAVPASGNSEPLSITFRTTDTTPIPTLPVIDAVQLATIPTPAMISSFLDRINACYKLPLTQRVDSAANDSTNATGGPANIVAPACRTLFVDNDPATYIANGTSVGRDAEGRGAFESLFRFGPTGLVHDRGTFEFFRTNGDLLITYRWTDIYGNTDNDTFALKNQAGVLKLTGNGNTYRVTVRPVSENREYLNAPQYSAYTTGYNVSIDNRLSNGSPIFDHVTVTTPWNSTLTFVPQPGLSYLAVMNAATPPVPTAGSVIRLAAGYQNTSTAGNLSDKEPNIFFQTPQYTEAQLRALNDQSIWKFEFVHTNLATPNVIQYQRTFSRAATIDEIRQMPFVALTDTMRSEMTAQTSTLGYFSFGAPSQNEPNNIEFSADGDLDAWVVPNGALAPTSFTAYGRAPYDTTANTQGDRFNDNTTLRNTARKAILYCSPQTSADRHCYSVTPGSGPYQYAKNTTVNSFDLWARSIRQMEMKKTMNVYKLQ